ncbi:MAG: TauD/TfdA family dioxygenase [Candidatus Dadabacteria bacterium]|nr:TauD/TfdA family dioxygenase [Candidatus Dadabacteria bacterium]MYB26649.1 TauD/TfdA family dioxygenase [Candidatus Dadabacteria bacterium]
MHKTNPTSREYIVAQLNQNGYVMLHEWRSEEKTISIARSLGTVVDIKTLLPESKHPTVQSLTPGYKTESSSNNYTGTYGLGEFPMHTDLAHWAQPPRYFMLRCQKGSPEVTTNILPCSALNSILEMSTLRRALTKPRQTGQGNIPFLLPLVFRAGNVCGFRWDSLFLVPMNKAAVQVADILSRVLWVKLRMESLTLVKNGDTVIIDNWRCLHGRSKVPESEMDRKLERVYLSEVYT